MHLTRQTLRFAVKLTTETLLSVICLMGNKNFFPFWFGEYFILGFFTVGYQILWEGSVGFPFSSRGG